MRDDLIKRSDAIEAVREYANLHTFNSYHQGMLKAISIIADIPTADRPSIDLVRCAECKRVREDVGHANCGGYLYCRKWKTLVDEDCFCSWGEREGE